VQSRSTSSAAASCSGCRRKTCCISWKRRRRACSPWQRELLRIVRHIAQYFYPQSQTKVMNEGTATYVHYRIMTGCTNRAGSDGNFLEFLRSHTNVVFQPEFDDPRFSGFNPYALGFAMMQDIERIVSNPDDEDREWFPDIAGKGDTMACCATSGPTTATRASSASSEPAPDAADAACSICMTIPDESAGIRVDAIHDERGYRRARRELARQYDLGFIEPNIEVVDVDLAGESAPDAAPCRVKGAQLNEADAKRVLQHLADLWSYDVSLQSNFSSMAKIVRRFRVMSIDGISQSMQRSSEWVDRVSSAGNGCDCT
jgi:stage V sporulation protein R